MLPQAAGRERPVRRRSRCGAVAGDWWPAAGFRASTVPASTRLTMSTATKLALGVMGRLRPRRARGGAARVVALPKVEPAGGLPLLAALGRRRSERDFSPAPLPLPVLSRLLWAAWGVNRPDGGRTAPSAIDCQELDLFVALPEGTYAYDASRHALDLVTAADVRRVTGYQDFVDEAPLDLVLVADLRRMRLAPAGRREHYAWAAAGAVAQNVYLLAASEGLATVVRAWIDRRAVAAALGLAPEQRVILAQTVGYPRHAGV